MSGDPHTRKAEQNAAMNRLSQPKRSPVYADGKKPNNTRKPRSGIPRKQ